MPHYGAGNQQAAVDARVAAETGYTEEEIKRLRHERFHIRKRARKWQKRGRDDDLRAVAAASTVEVKHLPPGIHCGWEPSWWPKTGRA